MAGVNQDWGGCLERRELALLLPAPRALPEFCEDGVDPGSNPDSGIASCAASKELLHLSEPLLKNQMEAREVAESG